MTANVSRAKKLKLTLSTTGLLTLPLDRLARSSVTSTALSDVPSNLVMKSRINYGGRLSVCRALLIDYGKASTIHGLRYICELHRPLYENLCWLLLTCASLYTAFALVWITYFKWQDAPIILTFDETLVPVHRIPFPTVTICPEIKTNRKLFNFTNISQRILQEFAVYKKFDNMAQISEQDLLSMAATLQLCDAEVIERFAPLMPKHLTPSVSATLVKLSLIKNFTAPGCKWNGRFYFGDLVFNFVATDEGICYQFNGLHSKHLYRDERFISYSYAAIPDFNNHFSLVPFAPLNNVTGNWSLESGYVDQGFNAYPQRTVFANAPNGFFVFLQGFEHNFDYDCRKSKQGYKVFLNSAESVPLTSGNYILVPHGDEVMVSVLPQYIMSTSNVHAFSPEKRQCYFDDERQLRFFRYYSQSNCQTECLANFTVAKCGCAKFWMPKPLDVPVCSLSDYHCYTSAQYELKLLLENQTMLQSIDPQAKVMCDCMPGCTSLDYNFEISRAFYDAAKTVQAHKTEFKNNDYVAARLSVFFKAHQFTAIKRTTLFGITSLVANCGGIFGLLMGISGLSIVEFFFFFSMRLFGNCRERHRTQRLVAQQPSRTRKHKYPTNRIIILKAEELRVVDFE